jgi:periplasmic iron binding protein
MNCAALERHRLLVDAGHTSRIPLLLFTRRFAAARAGALVVVALGSTAPAFALEYPIGKPQIRAGMELSIVYLQPVSMEPAGMMRAVRDSDIHLEADIKAQSHNPNGFPDGTFVPYLDVHYEIAKEGSDQVLRGELMPMVANDGPHYGDNVKLLGIGKYHVRITVAAPGQGSHFGRHTDKETGVEPWFDKPFTLDYEFAFTGLGKKGGY